jgi:5'-deoxynucleotidase YfbR-like HD superfamily hydrolase
MKRDVELLYELGMLRHLPRQWNRFNGVNFANLADHHFRVTWIALVIARYEGDVDTEKILKMAMVHDVAESRTNDVDYITRQYTTRNEDLAVKDIFEGTALNDEFLELLHEYEKRESRESKIVKDADTLDVDFEIQEQEANGVKIRNWIHYRDHVAKNHLYTKTAKKLYTQINESNPHDWHVNSPRNRFNGGDYKKQP